MDANLQLLTGPLRTGTWTPQELEYMNALIEEFRCGSIEDIEEDTTLSGYLAKELHCKVKRISKKMEGKAFKGRTSYTKQLHFTEDDVRARKATLQGLRQKFLETLEKLGLPGSAKYKREKAKENQSSKSKTWHGHSGSAGASQGRGAQPAAVLPPQEVKVATGKVMTSAVTACRAVAGSLGVDLQEKRQGLGHSELVEAFARTGGPQASSSSQAAVSANDRESHGVHLEEGGVSQELSRFLESLPWDAGLGASSRPQKKSPNQAAKRIIAELMASPAFNQQRNADPTTASSPSSSAAVGVSLNSYLGGSSTGIDSHSLAAAVDISQVRPAEAIPPSDNIIAHAMLQESHAPRPGLEAAAFDIPQVRPAEAIPPSDNIIARAILQESHAPRPGLDRWNTARTSVLPSNESPLVNAIRAHMPSNRNEAAFNQALAAALMPRQNTVERPDSQALGSISLGISARDMSRLSLPNASRNQGFQASGDPAAVDGAYQLTTDSRLAMRSAIRGHISSTSTVTQNETPTEALIAALQGRGSHQISDEPDSKRPRFS